MKKETYCNLRFLEALNDILIVKSVDKPFLQATHRLNRKLTHISDKLIKDALNNPISNPHLYDEEIRAAYDKHLKETYRAGEKIVLDTPQLQTSTSPIPDWKLDELMRDRVFQASDRTIQRLTGHVYPKIQEGIREGRSLERTTKALQSEFRDMTQAEVRRIAKTETHRVYNESKYQTMNQSDKIKGKKWLSSGLARTRPAHAAANGQIVATDEPFIVDGERLMYPGDSAGSAGNVINCRCTMVPVIRDFETDKPKTRYTEPEEGNRPRDIELQRRADDILANPFDYPRSETVRVVNELSNNPTFENLKRIVQIKNEEPWDDVQKAVRAAFERALNDPRTREIDVEVIRRFI